MSQSGAIVRELSQKEDKCERKYTVMRELSQKGDKCERKYTVVREMSQKEDKRERKYRQACVRQTSFLCGQKYSVLPVLSLDGILALDIFEGSVNCERFMDFLQDYPPTGAEQAGMQ